ncbi:ion transport protein domain-containing protein [Ditylenchus destructor]|uniref:Ion transport protein domain-containing protein n=1 Tax=Ditylenchus destructor TaxID=166010 RepID=A0AAD4N7U4_9BILA|nr:ion transport protein domain-containing protein [Ditylenchus destructor]
MLDPAEINSVRRRYFSRQQEKENRTLHQRIQLAHRQLRSNVYNFLERPNSTLGVLYHVAVFSYIIFLYCLSAATDHNSEKLVEIIHKMEIVLAVYFLSEFVARLWSVGADGKYQGFMGRLAYLKRPVCMMDVLILCATVFVVLVEYRFVENTAANVDKLRFLQILRLFHIDRQMTTWKLIRKMIRRSRYELMSAYYIAFMVFLTLAVCVYNIETGEESEVLDALLQTNQSDTVNNNDPVFNNFGDSFWFSIVSVLTIGYGDIVPRHWQSKVVVCFFSYIGLSIFSAASGLVGVGMSLMLHNQNKQKKKSKVRDLAARVIQTWFKYCFILRYCAKLQHVEERIRKARFLAKRAGERRVMKKPLRLPRALIKQLSMQDMKSSAGDGHTNEPFISKSLMRSATNVMIPDKILEDQPSSPTSSIPRSSPVLSRKRIPSPSSSIRRMLLDPELSPNSSAVSFLIEYTARAAENGAAQRRASGFAFFRPNVFMESSRLLERRGTSVDSDGGLHETASTISLDFSDEEKILDYYYDPYRSHSNSISHRSEDNSSVFDESLTGHYRAILRMIYFFLFITIRKRFKRARKPYELMDAEAELCEMEHQRAQKFKELELRLEATIGGKAMPSALECPQPLDGDIDESQFTPSSIQRRVEICENKMVDLERKAQFIEQMANLILKNMQNSMKASSDDSSQGGTTNSVLLPPPSPRSSANTIVGVSAARRQLMQRIRTNSVKHE